MSDKDKKYAGECNDESQSLVALLQRLEKSYITHGRYVSLNDTRVFLSDKDRWLAKSNPDLFLFASRTRVVLNKWIVNVLEGIYKKSSFKAIEVNVIHTCLRQHFQSHVFAKPRLIKMLGTSEFLSYGKFLTLKDQAFSAYSDVVGDTGSSHSTAIASTGLRIALSLAGSLSQAVGLLTVFYGNISRTEALRILFAHPRVGFDQTLKPYYTNEVKRGLQKFADLLWRIEMMLVNGLIGEDFLQIFEGEHELGPTKARLEQITPFDCPPLYIEWSIERLYCWGMPIWFIELLLIAGIGTMGELDSVAGLRALSEVQFRLRAHGVTANRIEQAFAILNRISCLSRPSAIPCLLDEYVTMGRKHDGERLWIILVLRAQGKTLEQIGELFSFSRERARQLEVIALKRVLEWVKKYGQKVEQATQRWTGLIDERLGKALLGEEGWSVLVYYAKRSSSSSDSWFFWEGPDLLLCRGGHKLLAYLEVVEHGIGEYEVWREFLPELAGELQGLGYCFITPEILLKHFLRKGFHLHGVLLTRSSMTLGTAITFIADQNFDGPLRMQDDTVLKQLRSYLKDLGIKHSSSDRALWARIQDVLVLCDRGSYISPRKIYIPQHLLDEICDFIERCTLDALTYEQVFHLFQDRLVAESNVNNPYFLHGVLKFYYPDRFIFQRDHITKLNSTDVRTNIYHVLEEYLRDNPEPVGKGEIGQIFPGWGDNRLYYAQQHYPQVLTWGQGMLMHASHLQVEEYKDDLEKILNRLLANPYQYVSSYHVVENVDTLLPEILVVNNIQDQQQLFSLLEYMFGSIITFSYPHILLDWQQNRRFTYSDLIERCLGRKKRFSYTKLLELLEQLLGYSTSGVVAALRRYCYDCFQLNADEYIRPDCLEISEDQFKQIQVALEEWIDKFGVLLVSGENDWGAHLPNIGYEWSPFLLSSIVSKKMPDFRVLGRTHSQYATHAVVASSSPFYAKEDVAIWLLRRRFHGLVSLHDATKYLISTGLYVKTLTQAFLQDKRVHFYDDDYLFVTES